jgi:hypothetical protein
MWCKKRTGKEKKGVVHGGTTLTHFYTTCGASVVQIFLEIIMLHVKD